MPNERDILENLQHRDEDAELQTPTAADEEKSDEIQDAAAAAATDEKSAASGKSRKIFRRIADDDEDQPSFSLRTILGGDFFEWGTIARWSPYVAFLVVIVICYVSVRYSCQHEAIRREDLNQQLVDRKFKALTVSGELTEYSMRSNVEEKLSDTTLQTTTQQAYLLPIDSTQRE